MAANTMDYVAAALLAATPVTGKESVRLPHYGRHECQDVSSIGPERSLLDAFQYSTTAAKAAEAAVTAPSWKSVSE